MKGRYEMIGKDHEPILIAPEEVADICSRAQTVGSIYRALDIRNAIIAAKKGEADEQWVTMCVLAAIYDGGRIQGIREERRKKKCAIQ